MKINAIVNLRPGALVSFDGAEITHYEHDLPMPSDAEIAAEIARIEAERVATQYQRDRAKAYPSIVDQLDTLYHGGIDAWKAEILAVKTQYPKPQVEGM